MNLKEVFTSFEKRTLETMELFIKKHELYFDETQAHPVNHMFLQKINNEDIKFSLSKDIDTGEYEVDIYIKHYSLEFHLKNEEDLLNLLNYINIIY